MKQFFEPLEKLEAFLSLCTAVEKKKGIIHAVGPAETQKAHLMAALLDQSGRQGLVVSWSESAARQMAEDMSYFNPSVTFLPQADFMLQFAEGADGALSAARAEAMYHILQGNTAVISVGTLLDFIAPPDSYKTLELKEGTRCKNPEEQLVAMGYKRVPMVETFGQFSIRGGILDVFPPAEDAPCRIEFFDDTVDGIRHFDLESQQSTERMESVRITTFLADGEDGNILDYFGEDAVILLDEPRRIREGASAYAESMRMKISDLMERQKLTDVKDAYIHDFEKMMEKIERAGCVGFSAIGQGGMEKADVTLRFSALTLASYAGKVSLLCEDVARWQKDGYRIFILAGTAAKVKGISEALLEENITVAKKEGNAPEEGKTVIYESPLRKGFLYPEIKTAYISGSDIFVKKNTKRKAALRGAQALRSFDELRPGDFVVHRVHGIGQFISMEKIETDHIARDYLKIAYRSNDFLYVPVTQLNLLYKYSHAGAETAAPRVSRLGGGEWQKTKQSVKHSVRELAIKLIDLYAERSRITGHAFSKDTPWQADFEGEFIYEETPDQLVCIEEVKKDMESAKPMDRLLCGDVGYGKTEVAIRAAFKCVMDGMQCAYLVPTTILASQHYNHFKERMEHFPIRVELLSRFRTASEQREVLKALEKGEVDILVGTHRLLGNDVKYKRLGLLIVDEEQRFGVGHKEKIKAMKTGIDVLTMTATPIPRTLNMAMTGIRDMSVLSNPPAERQAIQTYVFEYDESVVRDAVEREMARGGQVYYVFNRVQGIYRVAEKLQALLPAARIIVAHGRMSETELEDAMQKMIEGEADVLVSTTIIESGIDIPNVNTLIVENADQMGLSQLYQLRGRVGRADKIAYAFLTFRRDKSLSEIAEKRLLAIKEFTELGSGFKIALRDLEIRGAGNLLGPEQHGFMSSVGYDMYVRLLEEAVSEMRGEVPKTEAIVDLVVDAGIPDEYIEDPRQRLEAYRMIAEISSEKDAETTLDVLIDRFGEPPARTVRLFDVALLRVYAEAAGIGEITQSGGKIILYYDKTPNMERVSAVMAENRGGLLFGAGERPYLALRESFMQNTKDMKKLKKLLKDLKIS